MKRPFLIFSFFLSALISYSPPPLCAAQPAIDFKLPSLEGKDVRLSDFRGKVIILKLATTWCPTCKQQSEEIFTASEFFNKEDLVLVEVFLQDSEKMVRDFLAEKPIPIPFAALIDDGEARKDYNVFLIPRVLLIDRDFNIRRDGNFISSKDLVQEITPLLQKDKN